MESSQRSKEDKSQRIMEMINRIQHPKGNNRQVAKKYYITQSIKSMIKNQEAESKGTYTDKS